MLGLVGRHGQRALRLGCRRSSSLGKLCATAKVTKEPLPLLVGLPSGLVGPEGAKRNFKASSGAAPPCRYVMSHPDAPDVRLATLMRHDLVLWTRWRQYPPISPIRRLWWRWWWWC